jgi:rhodanese-related sulfurtransferase
MAPLVPDIFSNELSILSALLVGIAFGYVIEQAGFSSSRRLAGLFYGTDFTVLRVFFTAAITAMAGVLILGWAGLLDLDVIYVLPTFMGPAIVGGIIMGVGFVVGGYCPGTSVCAAAIGKRDAWAFVGGGLLGVLLYGELYPAFATFANRGDRGPLRVYESLGISAGLFALLLIAAAVLAFAATSWIEKRVNPEAPSRGFSVRHHRLAGAGLLALGVLLVFLPDRKTQLLAQVADPAYQRSHSARTMTADELAFRLIDRDPHLLVVDLRGEDAQKRLTLPASVAIPLEGVMAKEWAGLLGTRHVTRVFVDEDGTRAVQGALLAQRLGYENVRVLEGGLAALESTILAFEPTPPAAGPAQVDAYRFRAEARVALSTMIADAKARAVATPKPVRAPGPNV